MQWAVARAEARTAHVDTATVFARYGADVSRWVRALAGPSADAEDLVQEVFIAVHRGLPDFRGDSALSTWLFGIAQNVVRRHRRVQWARRWLKGSASETAGQLEGLAPLPPDELAREQARRRVYRVLDQLSETHRTVLILFELEGKSAAEVGALCGATPNAVWVRLHRARAQFHERLDALERSEGVA